MKIPFFSSVIESRKEANKLLEREIELKEQVQKARSEISSAVVALSQNFSPALSNELYATSPGSAYKIGTWKLPITQMRRMSRIAYWDSSFAKSIIDRWVQLVVGKGLDLEVQPAWGMITGWENADQERKKAIVDLIETRWNVFSKSKKVHYTQEFNLNRLINQAFFYYLYDGEFFVVFRYTNNGRGRNPLTIELIAPENIQASTSQALAGNTICEGIEYDRKGVAVAYHVLDPDTGKSQRIPKFGARSGRQFVYHNYNKKNERQRRGVPLLTGEISEITQLADYQALEIQAAKLNALIALWVEPPEHSDGRETLGAGARKKSVVGIDSQTGEQYTSKLENMDFPKGGVIVDQLPAGHKIQSFDTKRPNVNFDGFQTPVKKNIAAGTAMALSVADYNFAQQYSSARGELIVLYYKVFEYRENVPADLLNVIYKMWLWGEVEAGKINLPGFVGDEEVRDAWSNAHWRGESRPDIDPEKSMKAHRMEIEDGIKHRQRVASERDGGNVSENIMRLTSENQELANANEPLMKLEKTTYSESRAITESTSTSTSIIEEEE